MSRLRPSRRFRDRRDAGQKLARVLQPLVDRDVIVLGLPRGGVRVAAEVARVLQAPLDVIVVRKIGVPWQSELAMGAVGEDGVRVLNSDVVRQARVAERELADISAREMHEVETRAAQYRGRRARVPLEGRTVVIVDDGIATGATARAACQVARGHGASRILLAVPVAPVGWTRDFEGIADECVAVETPRNFIAVGAHYTNFDSTSDDEVESCLVKQPPHEEEIRVPCEGVVLVGTLTRPSLPRGLVVFAHGSGSSHLSVRNRLVASRLVSAGFATGLVDLLTNAEAAERANVFDVGMLSQRLLVITHWLQQQTALDRLPLGYFGSSTGAAAALGAAAQLGDRVSAVVSRGGRPDLARSLLGTVRAPTLLIVGGADHHVVALNEQVLDEFRCPTELSVVPGATHLFAEPNALESVADLAAHWYREYLIAQQ
ncbi:MAG: phosphoribosyltransferase family protein [Actinomycetes bacterium]